MPSKRSPASKSRRRKPRGKARRGARGRELRRYEIIVPRRYNDGRPVERGRINLTYDELAAIFGGCTSYPVSGAWQGGPREDHHLIWVDVPDTAASETFFRAYQATLEARFAQAEIYIRSYRVSDLERLLPKRPGG